MQTAPRTGYYVAFPIEMFGCAAGRTISGVRRPSPWDDSFERLCYEATCICLEWLALPIVSNPTDEETPTGLTMLKERVPEGTTSHVDSASDSANDFVREVELSLAAGRHVLARQRAAQGHALHPVDPTLARMAMVLAPPRLVERRPPSKDVAAHRAWLVENRERYLGRWVALRGGELAADAATPAELKRSIPDARGLFITKVN